MGWIRPLLQLQGAASCSVPGQGSGSSLPLQQASQQETLAKIIEGFGLERTWKIIQFQPPCHRQGHLPPDQGAPSAVQPGLEHCQGWGTGRTDPPSHPETLWTGAKSPKLPSLPRQETHWPPKPEGVKLQAAGVSPKPAPHLFPPPAVHLWTALGRLPSPVHPAFTPVTGCCCNHLPRACEGTPQRGKPYKPRFPGSGRQRRSSQIMSRPTPRPPFLEYEEKRNPTGNGGGSPTTPFPDLLRKGI